MRTLFRNRDIEGIDVVYAPPAGSVLMVESFYIGAYWGPREESLDACADRAVAFLTKLSKLGPALSQWYELGRSRADALRRPVPIERGAVRALLQSGRNRRDTDKTVIKELGYSIDLWNGQEPSTGLGIGCGKVSPRVKNAVVLSPDEIDALDGVGALGGAKALMSVLVKCWEPEWATFTSQEWAETQGAGQGPVIGWLTYLADRVDLKGVLPTVMVDPLGSGSLIVAAERVEDVTESSLTVIKRAIQGQLERRSFFRRLK